MSSSTFIGKLVSGLTSLPEKFYSLFPGLRREYTQVHQLNTALAKIEQVAFPSFSSFQENQKISLAGKTIEQWLDLTAEKMQQPRSKDLYVHERAEWDRLEQQFLALQYRSGAIAKGTDPDQGRSLFQKIEPIIRKYLASVSLFPGRHNPKVDKALPQLNPREKGRLEQACQSYPALIERFLCRAEAKNDPWIASFVKWVLRSNCNIGVFVKAPQEREMLASIHLDKRSGAVDGKKGICFQDVEIDGRAHKVVCLNIDDQMVPIQGPFKKKTVTLRNLIHPFASGLTLTIEKIFRMFKEKTTDYGKVEYLKGGVRNWSAIELGSYNQSSQSYDTLEADRFFDELLNKVPLPPLSEERMRERYANWQALAPNQWGLSIRSNRSKPDLNVLQSHGYKDLIYRRGDQYYIFPMGIQPKKFPRTPIEKFLSFPATLVAAHHYPDEAYFLSQRDDIGWIFPLSEQETARMQKDLIETYSLSKKGFVNFQFAGDNCAFHIQQLFDKVIAAPFYEKIQSVLNTYLSSQNIVSRQLIKNNSVRAFQGLNHDLLREILSYMVDDLWKKKDIQNLKGLTQSSLDLLAKIYNQPFAPIPMEKVNFSDLNAKEATIELLFQTIEISRFYRMDLFRGKTDQAFLATINKIIHIAPWRWLKRGIINAVLFFMGSWRFVIAHKQDQESPFPQLSFKSLAANPLLQEGYLHHPAALWEWISLRGKRLSATQKSLNQLYNACSTGL